MIIGSCKVYLNVPFSHSLKEKRTVVKSIIDKVKHKFNVAIAEIEDQDVHQSIVIGLAVISNNSAHANSMIQTIVNYIEENTSANLLDTYIEII
ncbi:DUF503 domain-containing protein [Clostridium sp.]|uniref:DUF503 domain-containing protein n=1 Tax=Clostridium sp. TaxID=1506 RepID=UPI002FCAF7D0